MRRWQRPSQHPSPFVGTLLLAVLFHNYRSILFFPVLSPSISSTTRSVAPTIAFVSSSSPKKTAICKETWLRHITSHIVFTARKTRAPITQQVYLSHKPGSLWSSFSSKALFAELYVPHHYSWYLYTTDDTYVLVDDLMQELAAFDPDEPYMAVIGPSDMLKEESHSKPIHFLVVASRGAMTNFWVNIHSGDNGCSVRSSPDLCFADIVQLNLREDAHERSRYIVLRRHFSKHEMNEFTQSNGNYNDGAQMLAFLSGSLLSAHNLTAQDVRIIDLLLNRVKVIPKLN